VEKVIELLVLVFATISFTYLIVYNITLRVAAKKATAQAVQAEIDKIILYEKVEELKKESGIGSQGNDGFLKFVSQSRDWAFGYIEEAQKAIDDFQTVATPVLYNNSNLAGMKELIVAYEKLLKMLPENSDEES